MEKVRVVTDASSAHVQKVKSVYPGLNVVEKRSCDYCPPRPSKRRFLGFTWGEITSGLLALCVFFTLAHAVGSFIL